jgi:hypothetical protein
MLRPQTRSGSVYVGDLKTAARPVRDGEFCSLTVEGEAVWLTARQGLEELEVHEHACRLISITETSDFPIDLSRVTQILGSSGVGIIPLSSYGGDHLLVKDEQIATAILALSTHGYAVAAPVDG